MCVCLSPKTATKRCTKPKYLMCVRYKYTYETSIYIYYICTYILYIVVICGMYSYIGMWPPYIHMYNLKL